MADQRRADGARCALNRRLSDRGRRGAIASRLRTRFQGRKDNGTWPSWPLWSPSRSNGSIRSMSSGSSTAYPKPRARAPRRCPSRHWSRSTISRHSLANGLAADEPAPSRPASSWTRRFARISYPRRCGLRPDGPHAVDRADHRRTPWARVQPRDRPARDRLWPLRRTDARRGRARIFLRIR
jgi:hypothetical protein